MASAGNKNFTRLGKWGYAGPWYGSLTPNGEGDALTRLRMLEQYGFEVFSTWIGELSALGEDERSDLFDALDRNGMELAIHVGYPYITSGEDEVHRNTEAILQSLSEIRERQKVAIATTHARYSHRFDQRMPVEAALERLSAAIAPLASGCSELGIRLGIENHGDFYCSDLVQVCNAAPGLYLFLDTGNTFLIGERPLEAFRAAAPYVIGAHFKDHKIRPVLDARPLHLEIGASALGDGDVPLRECYGLLREHAPYPDDLILEIEMICPDEETPADCLARSVAFIRTLDGDRS